MSEISWLAIHRLETLAVKTASSENLICISTACEDPEELFYKDYKETLFESSVVKTRKPYESVSLAERNNLRKHLPLTIHNYPQQ